MKYIFYLFLLIFSSQVLAQNLQGKVVDGITGDEIPFASVSIVGTNFSTVTNENGYFVIKTSSLPFKIRISHVSYNTIEASVTAVSYTHLDVYKRQPKSALDKEAYERATSVYLVDRVIPMLPERLSNGVCSLRPNEDKLCFSAVFELDEQANVIEQWFGRTVIHSNTRFSYEDAQEVIETKKGNHVEEILKLNELAYILRDRKFKNGAISFESTEVKFKLDELGKPVGVYVKERKDAHKLIEDFMLLANKKVAEFIAKKGNGKNKLTFVYRSHDSPCLLYTSRCV